MHLAIYSNLLLNLPPNEWGDTKKGVLILDTLKTPYLVNKERKTYHLDWRHQRLNNAYNSDFSSQPEILFDTVINPRACYQPLTIHILDPQGQGQA